VSLILKLVSKEPWAIPTLKPSFSFFNQFLTGTLISKFDLLDCAVAAKVLDVKNVRAIVKASFFINISPLSLLFFA
jgi:hypothetical protein